MTKRKVKQDEEEAPAEPTTLDRLNEAADRLFGEAFASIPEQIAEQLNSDPPKVPKLQDVDTESEDVDVD